MTIKFKIPRSSVLRGRLYGGKIASLSLKLESTSISDCWQRNPNEAVSISLALSWQVPNHTPLILAESLKTL
jgi:hypothetical protein